MFFWISTVYTFLVGLVLWNKGRELARIGRLTKSQLVGFKHGYYQSLQAQHHDLARMFLVGVLAILIVAEFMVRISEPTMRGWLFYTHLGFAIPGLIGLLAIHKKYNGIKHPRVHCYLGRMVMIFVFGTIFTGIPLFMSISGK
jgi:hypothetical protein